MRIARHFLVAGAAGLVLACLAGGCSTNAGFGTPVSGPNPINNPNAPYPVTPGPSVSGSVEPFDMRAGQPQELEPIGSPPPTPTPAPNTLSIVGPALRLAYDGSAKDPVKAPRVLELTFALQNTTQNGAKIASVSALADKAALGTTPVAVTAAAGQTSHVASVVLNASDDPTKFKELTVNFLDAAKKMVGSVKLDVPPMDTSFTSLDEKHPKGPFTIDGVEVSHIEAGSSPHFECTFAVTNASANPVNITGFTLKPPKGETIKIALPLAVPARSVSGFISIVATYNGKSLPAGYYDVSAVKSNAIVAKASAVLL